MTLEDLENWILEHVLSMEPDMEDVSSVFAWHVRDSAGSLPTWLSRQINPATIVSGQRGDRVFVRFEYYSGGAVTLFPASTAICHRI